MIEIPVPLIYLDLSRSFGGALDHAETRLRYYNRVLDDAIAQAVAHHPTGRFSRKKVVLPYVGCAI